MILSSLELELLSVFWVEFCQWKDLKYCTWTETIIMEGKGDPSVFLK